MNEIELRINKIAQGLIDNQDGTTWFEDSHENMQRSILRAFYYMLHQSHPTHADVENGIRLSGLKPTFSPCVVMLKRPLGDACNKILAMPHHELSKAFKLWLAIFSIADRRRRETNCANGCAHDWHNLNGP
jgi:hypothetical protein